MAPEDVPMVVMVAASFLFCHFYDCYQRGAEHATVGETASAEYRTCYVDGPRLEGGEEGILRDTGRAKGLP